jgi:hypothetical protein
MRFASATQGPTTITVRDRDGKVLQTATAPFTLTVERGSGYFKGNALTATATAADGTTETREIDTSVSGWYWGNLVFGGLIGMVIVDPLTGAMFYLPDDVNMNPVAATAPSSTARQSSRDIPEMKRVEQLQAHPAASIETSAEPPKSNLRAWVGQPFDDLVPWLINPANGVSLVSHNGDAQLETYTYRQGVQQFSITVANAKIVSTKP